MHSIQYLRTAYLLALMAVIATMQSMAGAATIVIVGNTQAEDDIYVNFITNLTSATAGVTVLPYFPNRYSVIDDATERGELENATLIFMGATASGEYDDGPSGVITTTEQVFWNGLTAPILALHPFMIRSSRLAWISQNPTGSVNYATTMNVTNPTDPAFAGITLTSNTLTVRTAIVSGNGGAGTADFATAANVGVVGAVDGTDNTILTFARWNTATIGQNYFTSPPATYTQGGKRAYFACPGAASMFNTMTPEGRQVIANIILDFLGETGPPPVNAVKDWVGRE